MDAFADPFLRSELSNGGSFIRGDYKYALIANGKLIFRKRHRPVA